MNTSDHISEMLFNTEWNTYPVYTEIKNLIAHFAVQNPEKFNTVNNKLRKANDRQIQFKRL